MHSIFHKLFHHSTTSTNPAMDNNGKNGTLRGLNPREQRLNDALAEFMRVNEQHATAPEYKALIAIMGISHRDASAFATAKAQGQDIDQSMIEAQSKDVVTRINTVLDGVSTDERLAIFDLIYVVKTLISSMEVATATSMLQNNDASLANPETLMRVMQTYMGTGKNVVQEAAVAHAKAAPLFDEHQINMKLN